MVFADETLQAFGITLARDVAVAVFFLALAVVLVVLGRRSRLPRRRGDGAEGRRRV